MKTLLNPQTISIAIELAKDIWQLLHEHPNHEKADLAKNELDKCIQEAQLPPPQETVNHEDGK